MVMVADVMQKYGEMVPFPLTPEKVRAAGYDVTFYLSRLANELSECEDLESNERAKMVCSMVNELKALPGRLTKDER